MSTTRTAQIATIKIAVKQLGLDDATYRAMLHDKTGKTSAADLDWHERKVVIDHLVKSGAKIEAKGKKARGRPAVVNREPYLQKIEALITDMGLPWSYAEKVAENITGGKAGGIKRLAWVKDGKHLHNIVSALAVEKKKRIKKAWAALQPKLDARGLTHMWCVAQAVALGRFAKPWPWADCLTTLALIEERLP